MAIVVDRGAAAAYPIAAVSQVGVVNAQLGDVDLAVVVDGQDLSRWAVFSRRLDDSTVMLALTETQENLWWGAIIGGFVVVLAVVALLTMLVLLVRTIEQRVRLIKDTLERAAANTADTALIAETAEQVDAVLAEGLEHHLFLGRVLEKVRL